MTHISDILINWYTQNKRDLPWRDTKDAYLIWLSEIILQQTRVDQGLAYFLKFANEFPTVEHLALADSEKIMKLWQGLGYYSRARNLHTTAQFISKNHNGTFPTNYADIRALKGVGSYTAAAIASFAFDLPYAVLDGNVYRVLSRLIGIATPIDSSAGKKQFESVAQELLNSKHPALHNQAIMEFGALQCKPVRPPCESCVLKHVCAAFSSKQVAELPVKAKSVKVRNRHFNYLFLRYKNKTVLNKRIQKDIWIDLYDFPLIETDKQLSEKQFLKSPAWKKFIGETEYTITAVSTPYKHLLSHQKIYARFWELSFKTPLNPLLADSQILIFQKDLSKYPVPRLIETYLEARKLD